MRSETLKRADKIINGERVDQYGKPENSFKLIAEYWSVHLGIEVKPADVAICMVLLKLARQKNQHKADNIDDAAGYLAILGDRLEKGESTDSNYGICQTCAYWKVNSRDELIGKCTHKKANHDMKEFITPFDCHSCPFWLHLSKIPFWNGSEK